MQSHIILRLSWERCNIQETIDVLMKGSQDGKFWFWLFVKTRRDAHLRMKQTLACWYSILFDWFIISSNTNGRSLAMFSVITLKREPFWINTYLVSDISEHWPSESKRWRGSSRLRSSLLKEDKNTNTVRRYKYKNSEWGPVRSNLTFRSLQLEWSSNKLSF